MESPVFYKYVSCIQSIHAEEILSSFSSVSYPHLKENKRKELYQQVKRTIGRCISVTARPATFEGVIAKIKAAYRG